MTRLLPGAAAFTAAILVAAASEMLLPGDRPVGTEVEALVSYLKR